MPKYFAFLLASLILTAGRLGYAETIIDTTPGDGTTLTPVGIPNTQTVGQVVSVPNSVDTTLKSFSFFVDLPTTLSVQGELYAWNSTTNKASGSSLFESSAVAGTGLTNQKITFNTGGVPLVFGQQYVIFASSSKLNSGHSGTGTINLSSGVYAGGQLVFLNNGSDSSLWTTNAWTSSSTKDLEFTADFVSAAPLPTSLWAGLVLLACVCILPLRKHIAQNA